VRTFCVQVGEALGAGGIERAETALARRLHDDGSATLESAIAELLMPVAIATCSAAGAASTSAQRLRLARLRQSLRELRPRAENCVWRAPPRSLRSSPISVGVMAHGGFDLVTGNPPWVRAERLAPRVRETLAARYSCWRPGATRGFAHLPDLAVAFVERAFELHASGGVVALLVPARSRPAVMPSRCAGG